MPYGTIKVDNVIYTKGGVDTTITVSGIVDSLSGAISVTGAISGASVSAPTGTFTTLSGNTTAGTTATFTSGVFTTFSGTTVNVVSGVFASGTVALPSVSVGTSGNGLYSPGANQLAISTSGTGRLTVDNSGNVNIDSGTFYVDAVNNRVGVGTTSPSTAFHIGGSPGGQTIRINSSTSAGFVGVGGYITQIAANRNPVDGAIVNTGTATAYINLEADVSNGNIQFCTTNLNNSGAVERMRLDASGNLGLGVVPSAWSNYKALQIGAYLNLSYNAGFSLMGSNAYHNGTNWIYQNTAAATDYYQYNGTHVWRTAPSGTAGAAITFTQAMTLVGTSAPALLVGTTTNLQSYSFQAPNQNGFAVQNSANSSNVAQFAGGGNVTLTAAGNFAVINGANGTLFGVGGNEQMRLDASGNLGLGVTPSAWAGLAYKAIEVGAVGNALFGGTNDFEISANAYYASGWKYGSANPATVYVQYNGQHQWKTSTNTPSTNGVITFTQAMTLDASGRLLVGATSSLNNRVEGGFQVVGTAGDAYITATRFSASASAPAGIVLGRSKSATKGTNTAVAQDDFLGVVDFSGANGSDYTTAATIAAYVDGAVTGGGASDMPGRLVFSTTADVAASPTEKLRITNDGVIAYNQIAPVAVDATATLTVANLKAGIITSTTAAAVTMTLPTGTLTEGGFSDPYTNMTFEWSVINTGATNAVTVQAGTDHTLVGSGTVAANNSGRFATRRTALNTWVTYRLSS